jgi:exopolysaccharide biosynthesis polyprenyl glycosylphosphotransferase
MLALADLLSAVLAGLVVTSGFTGGPWLVAVAAAPLWLVLAKLLGMYDRDHRAIRHLTIDELPAIAAWATGGVILVVALMAPPVSAETAAEAWFVGVGAVVMMRGTARWLWRRLTPAEATLIVGEGEPAEAIHRRAGLFADMHLRLVDDPVPTSELELGDKLKRRVGSLDRIIVASSEINPELIGWLVATCRAAQVKLSVVSPLRGRALPAQRLSQVADLPVFEFDTWDTSRSTMLLKRMFDLAIAIPGLLLTALLFAPIALAIRIDSRGSVLFTQTRAGYRGKPFRLYKFRTMQEGAEEQLPSVVDIDQLEEPMFKVKDDARVTRVGRVLRRLSLDELPQFFNVLRGEMSIVGPRPEQIELVARYRPEHQFRLDVKPGMTGPMQVHGRGELVFAERLAVELEYVENLSLGRDLKILARTVPAVVRGHGAY